MSDRVSTTPSDDSPSIAQETCVATAEGAEQSTLSARSPRRILKRIGLTVLAIVVFLVVLGATAYGFGSMETPSLAMRASYQALVASGQARPLAPTGFHIPIPGCRCHSADPVVTMQHEGYRIRDCSRCHGGSGAGATRP